MAPRISDSGALSEPIPSTTISIGMRRVLGERRLAGFFCREDFAAFVLATLFADGVGELALLAVGAHGGADGGEEVVAAPLGGALLGVAAVRVWHCSSLSRGRCAAVFRAAREGPMDLKLVLAGLERASEPGKRIPPRIGSGVAGA